LSRPRRFGKSLLISTLEAIFTKQRKLFKDLWIDQSDYDWHAYPVIRIDMSEIPSTSIEEFNEELNATLDQIAKRYNKVINIDKPASVCLKNLIQTLSQFDKVVVLIDEYDKPLLNNVNQPELANQFKQLLAQFYTILKSQDANLRFIFLTGVTKFSKVSVFSGLNNLNDISMDNAYSDLLGYTENEINHYFNDRLNILKKELDIEITPLLKKIKHWYNGYRFSSKGTAVFNPYSLLSLFTKNEFANYWFETATPTFLIELLKSKNYDLKNIVNTEITRSQFSTFDIENLNVLPLLYQTGYLTIKDFDPELDLYSLNYPNYEVERSFLDSMLDSLYPQQYNYSNYLSGFTKAIASDDIDQFFSLFKLFLANIPYDLQIKSEKYYHNIFYLCFTLLGLNLHAEVHTNLGRIDATIKYKNRLYLFEFKLDKTAKEVLNQIKTKKYYEKYADQHTKITLIGANFSTKDRNITEYLIEESGDVL